MPLKSLERVISKFSGARGPSRVIQICACNNLERYRQYPASSEGIAVEDQVRFDNCLENLPVPVRYNQYINAMPRNLNAWLAFVHNDFQFNEDPHPVLATVPCDRIYGVVGADIVDADPQTSGTIARDGKAYRMVGGVQCSPKLVPSGWCGVPAPELEPARTLDCCCVIVHSSLIRNLSLRFNEHYPWHFYSEEFSLRALRDHNVKTCVLPLRSGHYGLGATDESFFKCRDALCAEYPDTFVSTCFNPLHQA